MEVQVLLILKVLKRTNEINKCAHLAEMAIVYGNRFRPVSSEVNRQLNYSENLYYKTKLLIRLLIISIR